MRSVWHVVRAHRLAVSLLLLAWVAIWLVAVLGFDEVLLLHLPLILVVSGLVEWWRARAALVPGALGSMIGFVLADVVPPRPRPDGQMLPPENV